MTSSISGTLLLSFHFCLFKFLPFFSLSFFLLFPSIPFSPLLVVVLVSVPICLLCVHLQSSQKEKLQKTAYFLCNLSVCPDVTTAKSNFIKPDCVKFN